MLFLLPDGAISLVQFSAHLFPNLITPPIIDLRVNCKGSTGLCVSGFCGYCRHADIGIGQQNADEGVPEHMRMNFFNARLFSNTAYQCAIAIRVDRKTIVVADHEVVPTQIQKGLFEGPYLDMKYKGAQPEQFIAKPSVEQFKHYQEAAHGHIRYVTLATEQDDNFELTRYLTSQGIVVSIGHSAATYEQAVMAYANGARSMTHVYNGMTPFNHRANGLVGAAYRIRTMYGEIICDGCHSTPAALNNYFMSKGPDYSIMISDALMAKGTPVGSKYIFGGNEIVIYPDGSAHLTSTGGLAGSTLNINKGLKILVEDAMVPFNYALNACTINPARCLHLDDRKGSIQVGKDADIVVLEDNYDVLQTYCKGQAKL